MTQVTVIGAGLAGCEAAWALAERGVPVRLIEMKPEKYSPAHHNPDFCELVCSNSLKASRIGSASGLQKEEMRRMGSLTMQAAAQCAVEAGGALAVDRDRFAALVTEKIRSRREIEIVCGEVRELPADGLVIVAAGPLCAGELAARIHTLCGGMLSFFDAVAPIVTAESIDLTVAFRQSRYGRGGDDYINCPMNRAEYTAFREALIGAESAPLHEFDLEAPRVFEGCMPVEVMGRRGENTLRFGPLKPVGLTDPRTGHRPWAVVQLRTENAAGSLYNLVGFQTNLKFGEQKRVFSMIPGLRNAEFARYGVMHRNTFIDAPRLLSEDLSLKSDPRIFFAGQISGVEGYTESAMSGMVAGINAAARLHGKQPPRFPKTTMTGALLGYITDASVTRFQPMGANFGILPPLGEPIRDKQQRYEALARLALAELEPVLKSDGFSG